MMFHYADERYLNFNALKYCNKVIQYELKIPFNFYSLRHTHATILIQEGDAIKDVQERLSHSSAQTTLNIYTHNTETQKKKSISLFESFLSRTSTKNKKI